jgi:hypothetical protein
MVSLAAQRHALSRRERTAHDSAKIATISRAQRIGLHAHVRRSPMKLIQLL